MHVWGVDIFIKNNRVYATDLDIKEAGNPKCTFNLTRLDGRFALKSLQTVFETGTTESEKPMTYEQRRDVYIQRLKKAYSAWVEQAKASKGVSYNAFPKFVAPKCDDDLLEDPAVRDELLARRGYAKEIRNRYASAVSPMFRKYRKPSSSSPSTASPTMSSSFRRYGNPSSSSPRSRRQSQRAGFGGTVIQAVVHQEPKLNIDMIREIKNNHPAVPEPFLNESKLLDVEEDCRKAFLSSRTGRLGAFGKAFHSFIEAPSGDLVSAYILAIDSEDERKADVLLRRRLRCQRALPGEPRRAEGMVRRSRRAVRPGEMALVGERDRRQAGRARAGGVQAERAIVIDRKKPR